MKLMVSVLAFSFVSFLVSGQVRIDPANNYDERISNGKPTREGEFPYLVSITKNGEHVCGGFIYNQRFIVTVASCIIDYNLSPADTTVTVGQYSLIFNDQYERRYQVVGIITHEKYSTDLKTDNLAVIELSQSIAFTPGFVEVGYYNEENTTITDAVVMGWGATQDGGLPSVDLLKANVDTTLNNADCNAYGFEEYQPNYMICASGTGNPTPSPCSFDEGSPLVQGENNIIGIMSRNRGCSINNLFPTLYTRLSSYYAWINRYAGLQPPAPTTTAAPPVFQ